MVCVVQSKLPSPEFIHETAKFFKRERPAVISVKLLVHCMNNTLRSVDVHGHDEVNDFVLRQTPVAIRISQIPFRFQEPLVTAGAHLFILNVC